MTDMTYEESIKWLEMPDKRFRKADKEDFTLLMKTLGDPQDKLRFVHVTGSNGKGSVCTLLAEILRRSGYRTGLYTSPHLSVYNERCRIDGEDIPDEDLARLASAVRCEAEKLELSLGLFYKMTALSFLYFAGQKCDIVVLEVAAAEDGTAPISLRRRSWPSSARCPWNIRKYWERLSVRSHGKRAGSLNPVQTH